MNAPDITIKPHPLSGVDPFDGFPYQVQIDGQRYEKTGNTPDGRPVYCKYGTFRESVLSLGNEMLCVLTADEKIVPRGEYVPTDAPPRL
jgi:hypothetical protein